MTTDSLLSLEPCRSDLTAGSSVHVVGIVVVHDEAGKRLLLRSAVHGWFFTLQCDEPLPAARAYTVFDAKVLTVQPRLHLRALPDNVLSHDLPTSGSFRCATETCGGMGFSGQGFAHAGMHMKVHSDLRAPYCEWKRAESSMQVVEGDIGDIATMKKMFHLGAGSTQLLGGFSCQPWSGLGDRKGQADARASALPKILMAAHYLQCHSLTLECVVNAGKDKWVKETLQSFCRQTGFRYQEADLHLHTMVPAQRSRWWCILCAPVLPCPVIPQLPKMTPLPVVGDLLPATLKWSEPEEAQLRLDQYETRKFNEYGGIMSNLVNTKQALKTALHGWGNQLSRCPCSCREYPMTEARLASKGLFGALLPVDGKFDISGEEVQCMRHLHPWEIAVLHGVCPEQSWEPLRLTMHQLLKKTCGVCSLTFFGGMANTVPSSVNFAAVTDFFGRITDALQISRVARYPGVHYLPLGAIAADCVHPSTPSTARDSLVSHAEPTVKDDEPARGLTFGEILERTVAGKRKRVEDHVHVMGGIPAFATHGTTHEHDGPITQELRGFFQGVTHGNGLTEGGFGHAMVEDLSKTLHESAPAAAGVGSAVPTAPSSPTVTMDNEGGRTTAALVLADTHTRLPIGTADPSSPHDQTQVDTPEPVTHDPHVHVALEDSTRPTGVEDLHASEPDSRPSSTPPVAADRKGGSGPAADETPHIESCPNDSSPAVAADIEGGSTEGIVNHADAERAEATDEFHHLVVMRPGSTMPQTIRIRATATVGSITVAEERLASMVNPIKPVDLVGRSLPLGDVTHAMQLVHLTPVEDEILVDHIPERWHIHDSIPRTHLLYLQQQWVADDEFNFYLDLLAKTGQTSIAPVLVIPPGPDDQDLKRMLEQWITNSMYGAVTNRQLATAMVVEGHWIPVLITQHSLGIRIRTTPVGKAWIDTAVPPDQSIVVDVIPLPVQFHADCGFQSIGWLVNQIFDATSGTRNFPVPVGPHNAIAWRAMFANHVAAAGQSVIPMTLAFGGMVQGEPTELLQKLLVDHGVPQDAVGKRADAVLSSLGRAPVVSALRGPRAWRDLKQLANQATPKFQLVMAHELSAVIQARAPGKKFGEQKQKVRDAPKPKILLTPADIAIPEGIFRDPDGNLVNQIPAQQLHPDATGVVVLTLQEALPYVKLTAPFSSRALALVIIDPTEAMTQMIGTPTRIPANCTHTGEPVLITGRLLQIGQGRIERHMPSNKLKVEEVPNCVLRAVAFREELDISWEKFLTQPVKELMRMIPELSKEPGSVLDCWDRQFLSLRMQKCRPQDAEQFIVTFRIQNKDICALLGLSGRQGVYLEPREEDGRKPSNQFRVVWMSKMGKSDATAAMRATKPWVCLVRTGQRFGLRVLRSDAPTVHAQHKDSPYLDTVDALIYIGGPFPWGATRATLVKLFAQWKWEARPLQPKGRSIDGKGLLWEIQAAAAPQFSVYTLEHADILIAAAPAKPKTVVNASQELQGSAHTIAVLQSQQAQATQPAADPLQVNDPWSNKQLKTAAGSCPAPRVEMAMAQVEQRLKQHVQEQITAMRNDDEDMGDDPRIEALEKKVLNLEQVVHANAQTQQQQAHEMAGQIQQLNRKVDTQTSHLQQHMDNKLQEQLTQIEILLSKQRKTE
eukprot:Skav230727  [mRNA]  locus=scaffold401:233598:238605:- [translate_table: standard]